VPGKVLQSFGEGRSTGLVLAAAAGDPVNAAADGKVIFSGPGPRGYGNLIILKHDGDLLSVYAHGRSLLVKEGQSVRRGQKIAEAGDSGTDKPKLLFEVRRSGKPIDPIGLLPAQSGR
jgi:lipoprotein NlpD